MTRDAAERIVAHDRHGYGNNILDSSNGLCTMT
jgi:hypothetical protein